jgi:hypothetical protein
MLVATAIAFTTQAVAAGEAGEKTQKKALEQRNLWRLVWDNDAFVHTDNAFTNGWSLQRHSHQYEIWQDMAPSKFSGWISRTIPGLGDGGNRVVKRGTGLSQTMTTPEDISNPDPQLDDVPWSGTLGWTESWYAFDNKRLNAFQIYAGILGPYSFAEQLQVQIHDWVNADEPLGWDNQLKTEPLLNLNYAYKRRLVSGGKYNSGFGADMALGAEGGLGNVYTFAELTLEARFGWRLPKGFAYQGEPPGVGIMLDSNEGVPKKKIQIYFTIVARVTATAHLVAFDGNFLRESPHPGLPYDTVARGANWGIHVATGRFSVHFNLHTFDELPFESVNPVSDLTWGTITFDYRF